MTSLVVVGGVYHEICHEPSWHQELIGSGGRAAWVARLLGGAVILHACVDASSATDVEDWTSAVGIELVEHHVHQVPRFEYRHTLSRPTITPTPPEDRDRLDFTVEAPVILRFGMLEANPVVVADTVVYDPQSAFMPDAFGANGSRARRLAIVANDYEARKLTGYEGPDLGELANRLRQAESAEVAILKGGAFGTWVAQKAGITPIPCRVTERVWSLGSGDVFAAVFALRWALEGADPITAADEASRGVAEYVNSRYPPSRDSLLAESYPRLVVSAASPGQVYLAAPFFTMAQRWLVDELRAAIPSYLRVFSPMHDVGSGPAEKVAGPDMRGIEESVAVIAVMDGSDEGTLFEVGYARSLGIPVVVIAEALREEQLVMVAGSGCTITKDLSSAVYHLVWHALRGVHIAPRTS